MTDQRLRKHKSNAQLTLIKSAGDIHNQAIRDIDMPNPEYSDVRMLDLFSGMGDEHFATLMRGAYVQNFPAQIELITEGEPADFLHIVLSGSVDLVSHWNGRDTSMATVRPISTFILAATVKDAPYLMSARTLEKSRIALIPSQDVRAIFDADGNFARAIVTELAQCYRSVIKAQKDLKLRTSLERLANYLLRQQKQADGAAVFTLGFEKRRLASVLGMTPENLSRAFKGLQPYGVSVDGNQISIADQDDLERFAKPNPLIDNFAT
ncbi:cyclic nucleotide-binding domain-containing protein [Yoonia vestfoldensis]|uniref:Transcriptional activator FtrB n=1 Tax=Yoonia vestfoldensis TaxID=245188 RepID=A0A1Y0EA04_9RHOB|nr:cyclic nucleotide-binding domain-containing protein [Yoonia vestfoldensis]ARU00436.1 transcriptional activator FtrB [Yoonia vestfoldensis]